MKLFRHSEPFFFTYWKMGFLERLQIFEGKPPLEKSQEKKTYPRLSLNIIWDEVRKKYVARVPETPGVEAIGYNWENALKNMLAVQRLHRHIGLLGDALEKQGL